MTMRLLMILVGVLDLGVGLVPPFDFGSIMCLFFGAFLIIWALNDN